MIDWSQPGGPVLIMSFETDDETSIPGGDGGQDGAGGSTPTGTTPLVGTGRRRRNRARK